MFNRSPRCLTSAAWVIPTSLLRGHDPSNGAVPTGALGVVGGSMWRCGWHCTTRCAKIPLCHVAKLLHEGDEPRWILALDSAATRQRLTGPWCPKTAGLLSCAVCQERLHSHANKRYKNVCGQHSDAEHTHAQMQGGGGGGGENPCFSCTRPPHTHLLIPETMQQSPWNVAPSCPIQETTIARQSADAGG